jgi:hypothetical protein
LLLTRLFRLSKSELLLTFQAVTLVAAIRVGLWLFAYDRVRRYLRYLQCQPGISKGSLSATRITRLVSVAAGMIPRANCLTRALAAEVLLRRYGHHACLRIGVAKGDSEGLRAHAWVESEGNVVIGGEALEGLTPLRAAGVETLP